MHLKYLTLLGAISSTIAGRPADTSICDYYTTALLKENTSANQYALLTLVVNTALIGNYTTPNVGIAVTGILNAGIYNGVPVNLLQYFDGALLSTNNNGMPSSMSFVDGGGVAALKMSKPAFDTTSNQYMLVTHLYEYFGVLLGCSMVGEGAFPAYGGEASMYEVHKFMALDEIQVAYFIEQVGLSAASFGVAAADVTAVGMALTKLFNYKCLAPEMVVPEQGLVLDSICLAGSCPIAPMNPMCGLYDNMNGISPQPAMAPTSTSTMMAPTTMSTMMMPSSMPATSSMMMSAPAPMTSSCPTTLGGPFQFPHLIIPVSSEYTTAIYGTSFFGVVNATVSSIFNFDIPPSYAGAQCSLVFLFPTQSELQTSSYTFSGAGGISFYALSANVDASTSYSTVPAISRVINTITAAPGNSYVLANYPCPAGKKVTIEAMALGDTSLSYFQDYNPSPIGLYITKC